ncbi:MAG: VTT domain-containing protein [Chloroflexi bacterium]|nr:VTT domain-containing protein [Chloroflexota bacterium]
MNSVEKKPTDWKMTAARIAVLIIVIAITIFVYSIRHEVRMLKQYGYVGIFAINVIGSATIVLPAPALSMVFMAGGLNALDPFWIGVAAGAGATLGELTGYGAGFSGQAIVEHAKMYERLHQLTDRYGMLTIFILAVIPLPFFDLAGMAAGALRMPLHKFMIATLSGKLIKMWLAAYAGAGAFIWLAQIWGK